MLNNMGGGVSGTRLGNENQERAVEAALDRRHGFKPLHNAVEVPLERIVENPVQPRTELPPKEEQERFEADIAERGVVEPIIIGPPVKTPKGRVHRLIAGNRRFEAAKKAGLATVPAIIREEAKEDAQIRILAVVENAQRADITVADQCRTVVALVDVDGLKFREVDRLFNKHEKWSNDLYRAWKGGEDVQAMIAARPDSISHAQEILRLPAEGNGAVERKHLIADVLSGANYVSIKNMVEEWLEEQARAAREAAIFDQPAELPAAPAQTPRKAFKAPPPPARQPDPSPEPPPAPPKEKMTREELERAMDPMFRDPEELATSWPVVYNSHLRDAKLATEAAKRVSRKAVMDGSEPVLEGFKTQISKILDDLYQLKGELEQGLAALERERQEKLKPAESSG